MTTHARLNVHPRYLEEIDTLLAIANHASVLLSEFIALRPNQVEGRNELVRQLREALLEFTKIESFGLNSTKNQTETLQTLAAL